MAINVADREQEMPQTLGLHSRRSFVDPVTPRQALALVVPAAIASFALVLAVANASSRGYGLFYGVAVVLLAGLALRQPQAPRPEVPRWFILRHPMAIPLAMLFFALLRPLIG